MSDELWIVVLNWAKFQHYSKRTPIWIKLYMELRDKDEFRHLTYAQRGCLMTIWMEYTASRGALRVSSLGQKSGQKTRRQHLDSLVRAGFIQLSASKPLLLVEKRREEKEKKEKTPGSEEEKTEQINAARARNWIKNGVAAEIPADQLPYVLADEFKLTDRELVAELVSQALAAR